ncbi:MAG: hypothetical protein QNJ30_14350 [Kiloniellales bacterium]|nr:hypothetical protein [Kiloniellales bacterium]
MIKRSQQGALRAALPLMLGLGLLLSAPAAAAPIQGACTGGTDATPRIALISAFSGEADRFIEEMQLDDGANAFEGCVVINGHRFTTGRLRGQDVVVVLTNISIVNAAMVTQLALERFKVIAVVFSGIAGGIGGLGANDDDPATPNEAPIGSVVIPQRWGFHQEMFFNTKGNQVPCAFLPGLKLNHTLQDASAEAKSCNFVFGSERRPGRADRNSLFRPDAKNAFLRDTNVSSAAAPQFFLNEQDQQQLRAVPFPGAPADPETDQDLKFWFPADETLFAAAQGLKVELLDCAEPGPEGSCLGTPLEPAPRLIVGQNGVSGPTFVDNARYRAFVAETLNFDEAGERGEETDVLVLDMETTASAMVADSASVPFIAVRSVSDLAGGGDSAAGELDTFFAVAAENQARVVLSLLDAL